MRRAGVAILGAVHERSATRGLPLARPLALMLATAGVSGCGGGEDPVFPPPPVDQPAGWSDDLALREAVDENPDPRIIEIQLEARPAEVELLPGKPTEMWTYNGGLPGPLIRARVGDRLIVHFVNSLPEPTTVHWHGLRIPASMDGAPGHSQPEVPPGGAFEYDFVLPDAGFYWYHPHVDSAHQLGAGLYGPILVSDDDEPDLGDELLLVLGDVSLEEDGALQPPDVGGPLATLFGREGTALVVNGRVRPTLRARPGLPQRWRVVNAARSRYYQLELTGHSFARVGGDGGLSQSPKMMGRPLLTPGQRADLVVVPEVVEEPLVLRWLPFDRGYGSTEYRPVEDVMAIELEGERGQPPPQPPAVGREIEPVDTSGAEELDIALTLNPDLEVIELGINGVPSWAAEPLEAAIGDTQIWHLTNDMEWSHPFHLHGFFFQELDAHGQPALPLEWRDTLDVPYHGKASFVVRYDDRPGMWMFHCHILDHADAGMMGMLHLGVR
jgi:FtsP/CotA-like multicopper oxidase with cupredoxin domain